MARKKTISSKVKIRKEAYKRRQQIHSRVSRSWRILILTIKAVKRFSSFKHNVSAVSRVPRLLGISETDLIGSHCISFGNNVKKQDNFSDSAQVNEEFDESNIVEDIVKRLVSKVCRLDNERKRQSKNRKAQKETRKTLSNEELTTKLRSRNKR
ncbi:unnamed protein product, partial [Rotaria sp. Silwood1]